MKTVGDEGGGGEGEEATARARGCRVRAWIVAALKIRRLEARAAEELFGALEWDQFLVDDRRLSW